jgi:hypothetical protein
MANQPPNHNNVPFNYLKAIEEPVSRPASDTSCATCALLVHTTRTRLGPPLTASWRVNARGDILWGNVDRRIIGCDWSSRRLPWQYVHPGDRRRVQREWLAALQKHESFEMHLRVLRVNGEVVDVLLRGEPITCCGDKFSGFVGSAIPI